ncbi:MAG: electron transfer flavoprotein subunit beta/FixA family protein [Bacteroidia bacterium]|nr:electron transfer flavoprotein subunit beta/FixA family protein [Bacteroidia bacterium]
MKSLVCISHVPDTTTKIKYDAAGKGLDKTGVTFVINPYDEFGLVRAIEIKEKTGSGDVTVLCVGGPEVEPTLRKALAIGADNAARVDMDPTDSRSVAEQIAAYAKGKGFDLIFAGKESIDSNGSAVPGMVAELLDLPFISLATSLEFEGDKAKVSREIDGGYEKLESSLPLVLSCQKGMAEWRIPNMRGIMMARTKPLEVVAGHPMDAYVLTKKLELPSAKAGCIYVEPENAAQLVDMLHDKGLI